MLSCVVKSQVGDYSDLKEEANISSQCFFFFFYIIM